MLFPPPGRLQDFTVLAALLQQNPGLQDIDLAGNTCLPDRLLKAAVLAASCSHLRVLSLAGCEQVQPGSHLPEAFAELEHLDISNTGTTDADLQQLAAGLPHLKHLALRGCRRVRCVCVCMQCRLQTPSSCSSHGQADSNLHNVHDAQVW